MNCLTDLEVLAQLENLRLTKWDSRENADYILRVATAVVASAMGYKDRAEWETDLRKASLVTYSFDAVGAAECAGKEYRRLTQKAADNRQNWLLQNSKLTGKYAKLRDDLKAALEQTAHIEQDEDDGGTCNFDSPSLRLPRWNGKLIEQAAKEAGSSAFKWDLYGNIRWVFNPCSSGQGNRRSRRAEAITKVLRAMGYDAIDYCQAD